MPFQLPDPLVLDSDGNLKAWSVQRDLEAITSRYPLAPNTDNFAQVPQVRANHATVSIANNANVDLGVTVGVTTVFNSERYDLGTPGLNMHDTATNPGRLTCRVAGLYKVTATAVWAANATGTRAAQILLNGATNIGEDVGPASPTAGFQTSLNGVSAWRFAVGDYVIMRVVQTSGAALNVTPEFSMYWVSP